MSQPLWSRDVVKIFPSLIPPDVCERLIAEGRAKPVMEGTGPLHNQQTGDRYFNPAIRVVFVSWFETDSWAADLVKGVLAKANDDDAWGYVVTDMDPVQFCHYDRNCFFEWHADLRNVRAPIRKVSVVIQLDKPDAYEGGMFEFQQDGDIWQPEEFRPQGSAVVFTSSMLHRVNPIKSGTRHSLTAWFKGPPLR